jgi:hypothetical protein
MEKSRKHDVKRQLEEPAFAVFEHAFGKGWAGNVLHVTDRPLAVLALLPVVANKTCDALSDDASRGTTRAGPARDRYYAARCAYKDDPRFESATGIAYSRVAAALRTRAYGCSLQRADGPGSS